jgi:hypothetical protein
MITVITEHTALHAAKTGVQSARRASTSTTLKTQTAGIVHGINRALGETRLKLDTAIDRLTMGDLRLNARRALDGLEQSVIDAAHIDNVLWAAALLPADIDTDLDVARLRARREAVTADVNRHTACLVHALADVRVDVPADAPENGTNA